MYEGRRAYLTRTRNLIPHINQERLCFDEKMKPFFIAKWTHSWWDQIKNDLSPWLKKIP